MSQETRVLFNADCPICNTEICHYRAYTEARGLDVAYDDLNGNALSEWQIDADEAAKRLHVTQNGEVYVGVAAFAALWSTMPRYRWLAKIVRLPGLWQLANVIYDRLLAPWLYRKHLKRAAAAANSQGASNP
ncbi:DUF393 domain-containing protein [Shimia sp. R10_1]|uniref:thiol-disulfide oxidoreductase DCC family protein n=1 Tax=Shimia sp. R10_1 TaxID=2821095 RepID=UPI001ADAE377|nr:DUF393 domain-containing protein [Shimia sp. R10_1]MBO9472734.1 DUF393 domain-containing protein [Shimia sp. R10_1]